MKEQDIHKRLWYAPDGHTYFGLFSDDYMDHLFDVSKFLETMYTITPPEEIASDTSKLIIAYVLAATSTATGTEEPDTINQIVSPVEWFVRKLRDCVVYDCQLIDKYKQDMGLPIENHKELMKRLNWLNNDQ